VDKSAAFYCDTSLRQSLNRYLTTSDRDYNLGSAWDLSHNVLLASLSATAWRSLEEAEIEEQNLDRTSSNRHKGPVMEQSLEALKAAGGVSLAIHDYKKCVLQWLAERGCSGIQDLMYATHAKLNR
jgi:centromere protein I